MSKLDNIKTSMDGLEENKAWCYYSGLPSPYAYEQSEDDDNTKEQQQQEQNDYGGPNGHLGV
jgi:hypothetical protein